MNSEFNLELTLGAIPKNEGVNFCIWAPKIKQLSLEIIQDQNKKIIELSKNEEGYFTLYLPQAKVNSKYYYRFENIQLPDPASRYQPEGIEGPSQIIDPAQFPNDETWSGISLKNYIIYELHIGTFSAEGTFESAIAYLPYLKKLGITAIEVMPIAQFPGKRNWGYDGVYFFAVQNSYGGPLGFKKFVNACHAHGIAVILDVVYNHVGPEGNHFAEFGYYFTKKYSNPWGEAINFDGEYANHVRRFYIENAIYWFKAFSIDALRLDAIHSIFDMSAYPFLRELTNHIDALSKQLQRKLYVISESDLNDSRVISPDIYGLNMDAQWSDDFHHALHTLMTKEDKGYYQDFGKLADFSKAYQSGFVYDGIYSKHRKRPHGNKAKQFTGEQFVVCAQNHDQIGNRLYGDRLTTLINFEQLKLVAGLLILSPYIPLLFMGEEYGEIAPFQYFIDHTSPQLVKAVYEGRKREFADFAWKGEIPHPNDIKVFNDSKLNHELIKQPKNKVIFDFYQELIHLRKTIPVFQQLDRKNIHINEANEHKLLIIERDYENEAILMIAYFGDKHLSATLSIPNGKWFKILDTENIKWGGCGKELPNILENPSIQAELMPYTLTLYQRRN